MNVKYSRIIFIDHPIGQPLIIAGKTNEVGFSTDTLFDQSAYFLFIVDSFRAVSGNISGTISLSGFMEIWDMTELNYWMFVFPGYGQSSATGPVGKYNVVMIAIRCDYLSVVGSCARNKAYDCHLLPGFSWIVDKLLHGFIIPHLKGSHNHCGW
jgi:hypothetical protein